MNGLKTVLLRSFILFLFLFSARAITHAQSLVLKPDDSITPWFGFTEWVLHHAAIPFDSYDLTTFSLLSSSNGLLTDEPPLVLIDGHVHRSTTLINNEFQLPNLDLHTVDSVVISLDAEYKGGFYSPSGFIEIYTKTASENSFFFSGETTNEVNDPGPHLSSDLNTPNVEAIAYSGQFGAWLPELMDTRFFINHIFYTRTNRLGYDRTENDNLFDRTFFPLGDIEPVLQYNDRTDLILTNQISSGNTLIDVSNSIKLVRSNFSWNPSIGIENVQNELAGQHSVKLISKTSSFF